MCRILRAFFHRARLRIRVGIWFAILALIPQLARAQGPLHFFKNYFVTGDYVVGGVGLRGQGVVDQATANIVGGTNRSYATGTIHMKDMPANADVVAAFLYWQTGEPSATGVASAGTFRGMKVVGTELPSAGALACRGSGGGAGTTSGSSYLHVYRADVMRYLPATRVPAQDQFGGKPTGPRLVNDTDLAANRFPAHTVSLPDSGGGGTQAPSSNNQAIRLEGVSLLVVYRAAYDKEHQVPPAPLLRAVVIYDGGYTANQDNATMAQTIKGFYQATTTGPTAKMTHIVGNGDTSFKERLTVNSTVPPLPPGLAADNPFVGTLGSAWDNLTVDVSSQIGVHQGWIDTKVEPVLSSVDCLSWAAIVVSTTVQDTDNDGLLDVWETNNGELTDPNSRPLPKLGAMGADPYVKDLFFEIDYLKGPLNHSHLPASAALKMVGDAFQAQGIKVHFDAGNAYPAGTPYVIPAGQFQFGGGEAIDESATCSQGQNCQFPNYPGTISWKTGFRFIKNAHFDEPVRKDIFHYVLFAHALGIPKWRINDSTLSKIDVAARIATVTTGSPHGLSSGASVTVSGATAASGLNGSKTVTITGPSSFTFVTGAADGPYWNWGLSISDGVPRSSSGVADLPGGDVLVTLGLWDKSVGSEFMQASTLMHETGHNLFLRHGGQPLEPNCKPNYQSIMSYLFQVRGLLDPAGMPHVDYSSQVLLGLSEPSLSETLGMPPVNGPPTLPYLPRWYAPSSSSLLDTVVHTTPASKHCDGTPLNSTDVAMVRIDGTKLAANQIDWNGDGDTLDTALFQDVNFTGGVASLNPGYNDWAKLDLRQLGSRRNVFGYSLAIGPSDDRTATRPTWATAPIWETRPTSAIPPTWGIRQIWATAPISGVSWISQ